LTFALYYLSRKAADSPVSIAAKPINLLSVVNWPIYGETAGCVGNPHLNICCSSVRPVVAGELEKQNCHFF